MKIDFDMLEKMVAAGATGGVIVAYLREQNARLEPRRAADRKRKASETKPNGVETVRKPPESERNEATLNDTARARLFREGTAALMTSGRTERASRGLIAGWLKQTNDDDQLVTATIMRAQELAVADAAGWITATLKGKVKGNGHGKRTVVDAADDLIERVRGLDQPPPGSIRDGTGAPNVRLLPPRGRE